MADRVVQTENGSVTQQRDGDSGEACAEARRTLGEMPQQRYRTLEKKREAPAMIVAAGCFYIFLLLFRAGLLLHFHHPHDPDFHIPQVSRRRPFRRPVLPFPDEPRRFRVTIAASHHLRLHPCLASRSRLSTRKWSALTHSGINLLVWLGTRMHVVVSERRSSRCREGNQNRRGCGRGRGFAAATAIYRTYAAG